MPGIGLGISPMFRRGGSRLANLILWLDAALGKTGNPVSQWDDQGNNGNNAVQGTLGNRPADNTTYLTFDGGDFMTVADDDTLENSNKLTLYSRFSTSSATNFMGLIDKYVSGDSGYALFLNASKQGAASFVLTQNEPSVVGTTVLNDGNEKELSVTIECTRKFSNKRLICNGEEPSVIKISDTYYMFYDKWDGAQMNIYVRSDTSPYFENSSETLLISNRIYCTILQDGATFRLIVTDAAAENFILYTSTTVDSGYSSQGVVLTFGDPEDADAIADPCEIKIGSTYYLYYSAFTAPSVATICYATSATGAAGSYTKQGTCVGLGGAGLFDTTLTADPEVKLMPDGTTYIMFYTGYNSVITKQQQGYATSSDGITWTKFANNPIHYFTDQSFEAGVYGPNEPCILFEDGICRVWYRADNTADASFKIGYTEFSMVNDTTLNAGSETVTINLYVDGVLDGTTQLTEYLGIDYIVSGSQDLYVGGDNVSTLYFVGNIYELKIFNTIQTP